MEGQGGVTVKFESWLRNKLVLTEKGYRSTRNAIAAVILKSASQMAPVMLLFLLVADLIGDNDYDFDLEVWQYAVGIAVSIALMYIAEVLEYDCCYTNVYNVSYEVRMNLAEKIRRLPLSYFSKKDPAALSQSMLGDISMQENALSHWVPHLYGAYIFAGFIGTMLVIWSPIMGIAATWSIPTTLALAVASGRWQRRMSRKKYLMSVDLTNKMQEGLEGLRDLKSNDAIGAYLGDVRRKLDGIETTQIASEFALGVVMTSITTFLKFGILSTAIVGSYLLVDGEIDLIVFVFFLLIVARLYEPLEAAIIFTAALNIAEDNFQHMREVEAQPEMTGSEDFEPQDYDIVFEHVSFSYIGGQEVLRDVSFTAKQGEVTALIGPSGEGKTTAARLASRFWEVDGGRITVGGVDISTIDPEALLSKYSMVFQDVVLFNTSVKENIRMGRKGATDEEVLAAAEAAQCNEFVSKLPQGYDTSIGENGSKLSGGERQRISIARAILKDAQIILLDEATASLDTECESHVQAALSELVKGKTVVIVAHRMRTIEGADKIVVLRGGIVEEQGTSQELLEKGGEFARMESLQKRSRDWAIRCPRVR